MEGAQKKREEEEGAGRTGRGTQDGDDRTLGEGAAVTQWQTWLMRWDPSREAVVIWGWGEDVPPGPRPTKTTACSLPACWRLMGSTRGSAVLEVTCCWEQRLSGWTAVTAAGSGEGCGSRH